MFKENLMSALHQAIGHYNGGLDDSSAVVKAASAHDFNRNQTQRLIETYNTAKSVYFFKAAEDRRQDFGLAEPSQVFTLMYSTPAAEKQASIGLHDYSCYDIPEARFYTDITVDSKGNRPFDFPKQAAEDVPLDHRCSYNAQQVRVAKQAAERCRSSAGMCHTKYNLLLDKIASEIRRADFDGTKLAAAEHAFWEVYGKELSEPVVDDLVAHLHPSYSQKRASADTHGQLTSFDREYPQVMSWMKEAMQARLGHAEMTAVAVELEKSAEEINQSFLKEAGLLVDPKVDAWDDMLPSNLQVKQAAQESSYMWEDLMGKSEGGSSSSSASKSSPTVLDTMTSATTKGIGKATGSVVETAARAAFQPKDTERAKTTDRLRNLQRQLILEDLLVNDPVLAGENPETVSSAYQSLQQVAPEVSMNKEVVRSVLRAASQAVSVSPYDAKSWAELENEIRKQVEFGNKKDRKVAV
jgi:hypothetical protein